MSHHNVIKISKALISVSDKTGLEELAKNLVKQGVELISTGGTATTLRGYGFEVTDDSTMERRS